MNLKPYLTSQDLLDSVKRRISFPAFQSTFTDTDILSLANEEMAISQVPSVLQYHEGYFVYRVDVPLAPNTSRYAIPDRAIGMRLRDVMYNDSNNNLSEMTRVDDGDKAFFQYSSTSNSTITKFYLENNEVVLTQSISADVVGSLAFFIFLRPNQLVQNNRAAVIQSFSKDLSFNNALITAGDLVVLQKNSSSATPTTIPFTAVNTTVIAATPGAVTTFQISAAHNVATGMKFTVILSENVGSSPTINGTYLATSTGIDTFTIPIATSTATVTGNIALANQFSIGSTNVNTSQNFTSSVNALVTGITASNGGVSTTRLTSSDVSLLVTVVTATPSAIVKNDDIILVNFDQLPTTWQDPDTGVISQLYTSGALVDILQTKPGHRTYNYDVPLIALQGNTGTFNIADLMRLQTNGFAGVKSYLPLIVGDYICLQNESIIPQIPPDMHPVLAERTSVRILQALGDVQGVQVSSAKIQQMETQQGILLDNRIDDAPRKILNRNSPMRWGKLARSSRRN